MYIQHQIATSKSCDISLNEKQLFHENNNQLLIDHLSICPLTNQSINMINKLIQQSINKIVLSIRYDLDMLNDFKGEKGEKSKLYTDHPTIQLTSAFIELRWS